MAEVTFIAPLAAARVPDGLFAGLDPRATTVVDYIAGRDENKPFWAAWPPTGSAKT